MLVSVAKNLKNILSLLSFFTIPEFIVLAAVLVLLGMYGQRIVRMGTFNLVVVAVFCAVASATGAVLRSIPGVQMTSFLVIMAGVLIGSGGGLACGVVTALIFDLLTIVGILTPWHMLLWGVMGLCAAWLPKDRRYSPYLLAAYGLVWGFVFDWISTAAFFINGTFVFTWQSALFTYANGLLYDVFHAVSNAALLLTAAPAVGRIYRQSKRS